MSVSECSLSAGAKTPTECMISEECSLRSERSVKLPFEIGSVPMSIDIAPFAVRGEPVTTRNGLSGVRPTEDRPLLPDTVDQ